MKQSISLNAARAFIEAHFDEPVTLAQLAALSALSVSRFATVFRQQYGSSPYRYLCGLRIQRAQTLLLEGMPGSVVATEVGFFDQSHFGRHFKRCCGMTPSMFIARADRLLEQIGQFDPELRARIGRGLHRLGLATGQHEPLGAALAHGEHAPGAVAEERPTAIRLASSATFRPVSTPLGSTIRPGLVQNWPAPMVRLAAQP